MTEFKVGDKAKFIGTVGGFEGATVTVTETGREHAGWPIVVTRADGKECPVHAHELEALAAEAVAHPAHYGGKDNPYEVIKVAEAWGLDKDAYLFNVLKYVARAGKKGAALEDLKKGRFYIDRKIKNMVSAE